MNFQLSYPYFDRAAQAVHLGYVSVLRYLINQRYVSPHMTDVQGRTLPFLAIMYNKPSILKYLLTVRKIENSTIRLIWEMR